MEPDANPDQSLYWNEAPGQKWVSHQADLDAVHENVTTLLLQACDPGAGENVIDIGCGAGASTFAIARAVEPSGTVLGVDISLPLIKRAEERRAELGIENVTFEFADAQVSSFREQEFDLVASRFGVMFFSDPVLAFRNIKAGLRHGGRIAFAAWAGPDLNPWFTLPQRIAVARLGSAAPTPPDAPGPMAFRNIDRVIDILSEAGFSECGGDYVETNLHHPGGVDAVTHLALQVGPTARIMKEKAGTADDQAAIKGMLASELEQFRTSDGIRIPAGINVFQAVRK